MARKRSRRFGSPPAEHWARAKASANLTRMFLARARRSLASKSLTRAGCATAFEHIVRAATTTGETYAEGIGTERIRFTKKGSRMRGGTAGKVLQSTIKRFHAKCAIDPRGY